MDDNTEILEDIRDSLKDIANSLSCLKWIIIGFCFVGWIYIIRDLIKWIFG